jgi:hypothetical protein
MGALEIMRQASHASGALVAETLSLAIATTVMTAAIAIGLLIASSFHPSLITRRRRSAGTNDGGRSAAIDQR